VCLHELLDELPDELRPFAELACAGYSQVEIAGRLDCADRTVNRKLDRIRDILKAREEKE
jgi:DNA-directed RNA polymerase specialized sigma24 family protein